MSPRPPRPNVQEGRALAGLGTAADARTCQVAFCDLVSTLTDAEHRLVEMDAASLQGNIALVPVPQ